MNVVTTEWDTILTNKEGKDFQNRGITVIKVKGGWAISVRDYIFYTERLKEAWGVFSER